jgi:hypothetical protein
VHAHIHAYIHTYIYTNTRTYAHTYIHTYMHTCIHTYIHTCAHTCTDASFIKTREYMHTYVRAPRSTCEYQASLGVLGQVLALSTQCLTSLLAGTSLSKHPGVIIGESRPGPGSTRSANADKLVQVQFDDDSRPEREFRIPEAVVAGELWFMCVRVCACA